jgi:hypothetical protein
MYHYLLTQGVEPRRTTWDLERWTRGSILAEQNRNIAAARLCSTLALGSPVLAQVLHVKIGAENLWLAWECHVLDPLDQPTSKFGMKTAPIQLPIISFAVSPADWPPPTGPAVCWLGVNSNARGWGCTPMSCAAPFQKRRMQHCDKDALAKFQATRGTKVCALDAVLVEHKSLEFPTSVARLTALFGRAILSLVASALRHRNSFNRPRPEIDMAVSTPITPMGPLGPMTTPFLAPSSCGNIFYYDGYERDMSCNPAGTPVRDSSCYLSSSSTYPYPFIVTYSPAIACPIGWTSNKAATNAGSTQFVVCCPS